MPAVENTKLLSADILAAQVFDSNVIYKFKSFFKKNFICLLQVNQLSRNAISECWSLNV